MNTSALENMKTRRSCRAFSDRMPERELVEAVCEAGTYAPTGHGKQSPIILAISDRTLRDRLSDMNARIWNSLKAARGEKPNEGFDPFYGAPVVLAVLADRTVPTYHHDGCAVLCQLANAANAAGLDSCWIHRAKEEFDSDEGRAILRELGVDGDYEGIGHIVLGYRAKELPAAAPRKADYIRYLG
ncbi:MAG: nitroreductase family protein [Bacteroidales bacterium]|nr:nitroreductase family protein [Bacteroidales bacterium]